MTRREQRTVAVGAVVAVAIIGYWLSNRAPAEAGPDVGAEQAALLARLQGLVEQRPAIEEALARARAEEQRMRAQLFPEANPNLAGAGLSRLVEETARTSGMQIERIQIREPELEGALQKISVSVQLSGSIHGLRDLLYALESSARLTSVETLRVTAAGGGGGGGEPGSPPPLSVDLRVVGYSLPPDTGATSG